MAWALFVIHFPAFRSIFFFKKGYLLQSGLENNHRALLLSSFKTHRNFQKHSLFLMNRKLYHAITALFIAIDNLSSKG
jgi:hypothetical protein